LQFKWVTESVPFPNLEYYSRHTSITENHNVVVIIPALNEEASIARVVQSLPRSVVSEIVVVDNGSDDDTVKVASAAGATVLRESRRGYGYACLAGISHALKSKPIIIAFIDGDLSDYPEELSEIIRPISEDGCDMVIGSRSMGKSEPGALLPQAILGNWLACFLIRLFWGYEFTDLGPFRAITTEALQRMKMSDPTFGWTVEMQIKAAKLKLKCIEVPVRYRKRVGKSKVTGTISGTIKASVKILYTILKYVFVKV
jgi:glycosyltransferase involved in cell wall biosynthesis